MYVNVTAQAAKLEGPDNFLELEVRISGNPNEEEIVDSLAGWGEVSGDHVWLETSTLREHGRPDDPSWAESFRKMIAYADTSGWTRNAGAAVRAHIVRSA